MVKCPESLRASDEVEQSGARSRMRRVAARLSLPEWRSEMKNQILSRTRLILLGAGAMVLGFTLSSDRIAAVQPEPECGPTRQWICTFPPCLSCQPVKFEGTVCEKDRFEQRTGMVCTPR